MGDEFVPDESESGISRFGLGDEALVEVAKAQSDVRLIQAEIGIGCVDGKFVPDGHCSDQKVHGRGLSQFGL